MPVLSSCSAAMLTTAAPTRTSCIRSRYWRRNACHPGSLSASARRFGPTCARRRPTSSASRPFPGSTPSCAHASSAVIPCQAMPSRGGVTPAVTADVLSAIPVTYLA